MHVFFSNLESISAVYDIDMHASIVLFVYSFPNAQCARTTALIDQWISIEYSYFQAAWTLIFVDRILKPRSNPKHTSDEVITRAFTRHVILRCVDFL